jgi:hypothetical protein
MANMDVSKAEVAGGTVGKKLQLTKQMKIVFAAIIGLLVVTTVVVPCVVLLRTTEIVVQSSNTKEVYPLRLSHN